MTDYCRVKSYNTGICNSWPWCQ